MGKWDIKSIRPNEGWIEKRLTYQLPEPFCFSEGYVYDQDRNLVATIETIRIDSMNRGPVPIYLIGGEIQATTTFGLHLEGIKWIKSCGPSGAYYNGNGWYVPDLRIKWLDGESIFDIHTSIGFPDGTEHEQYTKGIAFSTLYSRHIEKGK